MKITVIRSARKTFCLEMRFGELLVRVPNAATQVQVDAFLEKERNFKGRYSELDANRGGVSIGKRKRKRTGIFTFLD